MSTDRPRLLLVEDNPLHARLVQEMLFDAWGPGIELTHCECLADIDPATAAGAGCILLDLTLPDAQGIEAVLELRVLAPEVPLVVLSSRADETIALQAVQQGAQDYLDKGKIDAGLLSRAIRYAIERKGLEGQLAHLAMHDGLTGLPNRALFLDRVERALLRRDQKERSVAVFFVDLDGFKGINDSFGHAAGDRVLASVAEKLVRALRPEDTVARFGGDEFCVMCAEVTSTADVVAIARRIIDALGEPLRLGTQDVWITASVGVAIAPAAGVVQPDGLIHEADRAMYSAKRLGKDRFEIHDAGGGAGRSSSPRDPELALRRAIENDELVLHYQPIVDLASGGLAGFEALVRWEHPERGLLPPAEFVPFAERTGLVVPLGAWVLGEACRQAAVWRASLAPGASLAISVNLSAAQLAHVQLADLVADTLWETATPPGQLWLEVTETAVMQDAASSIRTLERLRALGLSVTIDDFGTGHSSLAYLSRLPASILKVDRAFVARLGSPAQADATIVSAVVDLAHSLGMGVVAEGVETGEQLARIVRIGCEFAQGYHLARPAAAPLVGETWVTEPATV